MSALLAADLPYWVQSLLRVLGGVVAVLLPAGAIALLTIGVNLVVDWVLHMSSGLKD